LNLFCAVQSKVLLQSVSSNLLQCVVEVSSNLNMLPCFGM